MCIKFRMNCKCMVEAAGHLCSTVSKQPFLLEEDWPIELNHLINTIKKLDVTKLLFPWRHHFDKFIIVDLSISVTVSLVHHFTNLTVC